eukprot:5274233-Pleurochrysis_carterae.AAC.1
MAVDASRQGDRQWRRRGTSRTAKSRTPRCCAVARACARLRCAEGNEIRTQNKPWQTLREF